MKRLFLISSLLLLSVASFAQLMEEKTKSFSRKDSLRGTLSPERSCYDVSYYHLDVKIDIDNRSVQGSNLIRYKVVSDFDRMQIDLFSNLKVDKIVWKGKELKYTREFNAVFISFPQKLKAGTTEEILFYYSGNPIVAKRAPWDGGFVFKKDRNGNPWAAVACQGMGASVWWPTKDHQSDKPDSMMISITSPSDLDEISNGRLISKKAVDKKYTRHDWFVNEPINNYNVTFNIGKYAHWSDTYKSRVDGEELSLDYYVLEDNIEKAKVQFEQVKPMMDVFEKRFGKYPFYKDGYKLVETPYLGMEHQSCIAYGNGYKNGYMGLDLSGTGEGLKFDYIIIHESAHEWWGNSLTSYDIADMWIHEGFGQYAEAVYLEDVTGKESSIIYLNGLRNGISNKEAIIGPYGVNREGSGDMYPKGALFLNTLRNVINDDTTWWDIVHSLQSAYRHRNVSTEDVLQLMNKKSGLDLKPLFDQYLRHNSIPSLQVSYAQQGKDVLVSYYWKTDVKDFSMPVVILAKTGDHKRVQATGTKQEVLIRNCKAEQLSIDKRSFYIRTETL